MNIISGSRLGPYEMSARIGAGGMGEVWRAVDTRLGRSVAVKVLPAEFAHDAQLRIRLHREAKAISHLNHPNICTLHDVGDEGGVPYLVMELLDGESLADRLQRGPMPVEQVLRYGMEIASALARAHREGIVHRDLKPGNIFLTKTGAKLLDFGLALSQQPRKGSGDAVTERRITEQGFVVGTVQYMAPEQISGDAVDTRTDIFAFGMVLYEMVTGVVAFDGPSRMSLAAAILTGEPRPMPPSTPPALERVILTCLAKDPDERWQSAQDIRLELQWVRDARAYAPASVVAPPPRKPWLAWSVAAAAVIVAAIAMYPRRTSTMSLKTTIAAPAGVVPTFNDDYCASLTISPDGRYATFAAKSADGKQMLWLRPLDGEARPIAGTETATYPFWSPDSRFIAFFTDEKKLKKVDLTGGVPVSLCDAGGGRPGSWNSDGTIIFSPSWQGPIHKVNASGGASTPVTKLEAGESTHRWATFLPDGNHFLYMAGTHSSGTQSETNAIYAGALDGSSRKLLLRARSNVVYAAGYLLYARDTTLVAQPFDPARMELTGDPMPIVKDVEYVAETFFSIFSVSRQGTLLYVGASPDRSVLHIQDRDGKDLGPIGEPDTYRAVAVSPDGKRLALTIADHTTGVRNIWIYDVERNVPTRFTFATSERDNPVWSPDGKRLAYTGALVDGDLFLRDVDGSGAEELVYHHPFLRAPTGFSTDGKEILFTVNDNFGKTAEDVWVVAASRGASAHPIVRTAARESGAVFAADGQWIAYSSNETGHNEVYVMRYPNVGGKSQVSSSGGSGPHWRRDGRELLFLGPETKVFGVPVEMQGGVPQFGKATLLFSLGDSVDSGYTPDHQRWIVAKPVAWNPVMNVVTNWPATARPR
ncbi:MAG TPA: protein kinase [Thermoanaerobaculia bacterium]|nr:protein kinase [Thermoanaerobaculia bacterium]